MVCLTWLTLASGQNCTMHAGNFAATATLSLVLLGFKLKPFGLSVYKLQKNSLWNLLWAVVYCAPQWAVISTLLLRANSELSKLCLFNSPFKTAQFLGELEPCFGGGLIYSWCFVLRSRKELHGKIKLLQKPESLRLEQLILPSSHTSLCCFFATGFGNLITALFIQDQSFFFCCTCELVVVSRVMWWMDLGGGLCLVVYFQSFFNTLVHCWVLMCIHTDEDRLQRMFWSFWPLLWSSEFYWCKLSYLDIEGHVSCANSNNKFI